MIYIQNLQILRNVLQYFEGGSMKINYDLKMEEIISKHEGNKPSLLLHVCCAPCSSAVLERLLEHFKITIYYYNPNISPYTEYEKRILELKRLIDELGYNIDVIDGPYEEDRFNKLAIGLESEPEGGIRCSKCYHLRLDSTAAMAKELEFDYFTTTLSISPYKDASKLNQIGEVLERQYGVPYLYSDFKKKDGYKRSIELSHIYKLYRQDYCGCIYSKEARESEKEKISRT